MKRLTFAAAVVAIVGLSVPAQRGQIQLLEFADVGGNDATASINYTRDSSDNPNLQFRFTTSDTVEYTMTPSTLNLSTNTITANGAAFTPGEITVSKSYGETAADHVSTKFFIATRAYTVLDIDAVWTTAESTGAMDVQVQRLQATEACGSGDDLLSAVIDATGTAETVNNGTLTATSALLDLAAGDRLCVELTATPNEIVGLVVSVRMRPN